MLKAVFRILLLCLALNSPWAMAQSEPSMAEVYAAAQAGQLDKAQTMIQQVLVSHPHSAKAHYVRAELFAREGKSRLAQESLQEAERLAPGLPFAKPEAVSALKAQLHELAAHANTPTRPATHQATAQPASESNGMLWLLVAGGVVLAGVWVMRRKQTVAAPMGYATPAPATPNGVLNGPQTFGHPAGTAYPPSAPEPGMGSRIMGGVATGLAVGAGVMAAEAIGRRLMDHDEPSRGHASASGMGASGMGASDSDYTPLGSNADMGGSNFGVADGGWDDAGDAGGGSDWDN